MRWIVNAVLAASFSVCAFGQWSQLGVPADSGIVAGAKTLTNVNKLVKVTATGTVGESAISCTATDCTAGAATMSAAPGGSVAAWKKYSLVKVANGAGGCTDVGGCWTVNGGTAVAAVAGLTQDVVAFQLPAKGFVERLRAKTSVACVGAATINLGIGTAGNNVYYRAATYDLKAAVSDTNITDTTAAFGSTTAAAVNVVFNVLTTVDNVSAVTAGCAVDVWLRWAVLP